MTKFKGRMASIAPGLSVVATATVLLTGSAAHADNECGTDNDNDGVISCGADADPSTPGNQPYADGITYNPDNGVGGEFKLELNNAAMVVNGRAAGPGSAVNVVGNTENDISVILRAGELTTHQNSGWGIGVINTKRDNLDTDAIEGQGNVTVEMHGGDINTSGREAHGIIADTKGAGNVTVEMTAGTINTDARVPEAPAAQWGAAHGIWANIVNDQSEAIARVRMDENLNYSLHEDGELPAQNHIVAGDYRYTRISNGGGFKSFAIYAKTIGKGGEAIVEMDGGEIVTAGQEGHGVFAHVERYVKRDGDGKVVVDNNDSRARAIVEMTDGAIVTTGNFGIGLHAVVQVGGVPEEGVRRKAASVEMSGGRIRTMGDNARGIEALVDTKDNVNDAIVELSGTATIATAGRWAYGVEARTRGTGTAKVDMSGGTVTTSGFLGHGLVATTLDRRAGTSLEAGDVTVNMTGGTVDTAGREAHGLLALSGTGAVTVTLGAGASVMARGENASGIFAEGREGSFDVDVAGSVTGGSGFGAAVRTRSGSDVDGTIDIASTGIVTAGLSGIAIQDGGGDAVVTLEGTVTGDVLLGAGDDSLTIASAANFDFSHILDGGAGDNDQLTLQGQSITTTADMFLNWQGVTLNNTALSLDRVGRLDTGLSIDAGSEFRATGGEGGLTIRGDVTNNAGDVFLSVQNGMTGDEIKIEGNYTGSDTGSDVFALDMGRDADGLRTDTVVITGDASGEMTLLIAGMDSADLEGAPLVMDVVTVDGEADDATFTLMNGNYVMSDGEHGVISGAYVYRLAEVEAQDGRNWWALSARSESGEISWGPSAPIYDSYGASLLALNAPSALRGRGSSQDFRTLAWGGAGADAAGQDTGAPLWIQMGTEQLTSAAEQSTTGAARDSSLWEMEIGADLVLSESAAGLFVGGLMLSYGTGSTDVSSGFGDGSIETTGLGLGLAATWYDTRGFYVDGQVTVTSYSSDLSSDSLGSLTEGNSGTGFALSIEAG
ncbi:MULTISPECIES: autotransporter outer membrane beta-barrel domain-containing protein, partial [unclassified Roseobacter]